MSLFGLTITYFVMWWIAFLALLPVGVRGLHEDPASASLPEGVEQAAPQFPQLREKALGAFALAAVLTGLIWAGVEADLARFLPTPPRTG
jgi:predicted secreted protein